MKAALSVACGVLLCWHLAAAQEAKPKAKQEVLIDNEIGRVTQVTIPPGAVWTPPQARGKRFIIAITGNRTKRHAKVLDSEDDLPGDEGETISRRPGDAVYRTPSHHSITNTTTQTHISDIVEIKQAARECRP